MSDFVARIALVLLRALARLPYPVVRRAGLWVGSIAWLVAAPRRQITRINLRLCYPNLTESQREAIGRAHFQYFVRSFFERFIFWFGTEARIRSLVSLDGLDLFERWRGKPVILLAPHFVGIDAGGIRFQLESSFASMYAQQKSRVLTEVMTSGRSRFNGAQMFLRNDGLRPAIRALRDGVPFYFLPDMDLGPRDAVFVDFFGVPAATVTSVARLARLSGAVVIPLVTTMTDTGYVAKFYPAWEDYPGDDLQAATRRMNHFIEERVAEMPAQYLWSHKRFKTRPPGVPDVYGRTDPAS
jgi:Kdo2-lipid IVA lauroyltransferase/acyltransferase